MESGAPLWLPRAGSLWQWPWGARASVLAVPVLSSCGRQARLPCGVWRLREPGIESLSPALTGRFLTTDLPVPEKFDFSCFNSQWFAFSFYLMFSVSVNLGETTVHCGFEGLFFCGSIYV